ncbi:dethiobiotin synthase [Billgrantia endophytica]|uniref:ATP-dependent dethiobiotin synthetase BioD n=1 Tax=Billgrantia endophytica TaxID=2033802 RepID=A0A2N7U8Z1_9GAMM|nr:dethiobiotin synthase [Halomonas endophytica]PMR76906.1 dethiobiotin synthase [Halomonas endophytica]
MAAFFVTGTDTDVGKTLVATGLLSLARRQGMSTLGLKPIASGCERTHAGLQNEDALALQAQGTPPLTYAAINPFAFEPAIAPHLAARRAGTTVTVDALVGHIAPLLAGRRALSLVEGAGGWRVPLNDHEDLSRLAVRLELPVILVVGLKLGCISHACLTAEAIRADGLPLAGWVGNLLDERFAADTALYADNLATLEHALPGPCLGIVPRLRDMDHERRPEAAAHYLKLPHGD